ncbi:hypothetical protein EDC01DRAFT_784132 [Geopyxis carbonaria]|nr:hypothetical protein EDC01DRAFT_784132 [Geopyxis carbonaria]
MPTRALASRTLTTLSALTGGIVALTITSTISNARTAAVVKEPTGPSFALGSPERSGGGI